MAEIQLKVSDEALRQTYQDCVAYLRSIRLHILRIGEISGRSRGYWQGSAGEYDRQGYAAHTEELLAVLNRLEERSRNLLEAAGIYQSMTEEAVEAVQHIRVDNIL